MRKVLIKASKKYEVLIEKGLLKKSGELISHYAGGDSAVIVTDENVAGIYADIVEKSLKEAKINVFKFVAPAGEKAKSTETYMNLINFLAQKSLNKNDVIVSLGGGTVGDLSGFAASTYLRGINYVQIPTTFLASIDSSVGGKTALNLKEGKNLMGSFYHPCAVICDTQTFDTLPKKVYNEAYGELIKYAMIADRSLFETIKGEFNIESTIERCVSIKNRIISLDEYDKGIRRLLNFGHTIGHAVEILSDFSVPHGYAVSVGMNIITNCSVKKGISDEKCLEELNNMQKRFNLPTKCEYDLDSVFDVILHDKKRKKDKITAVLPQKIGKCILKEFTLDDFKEFLKEGF